MADGNGLNQGPNFQCPKPAFQGTSLAEFKAHMEHVCSELLSVATNYRSVGGPGLRGVGRAVTGTFAGLVPVAEVDGRSIGDPAERPFLARLQQGYRDTVKAYIDGPGASHPRRGDA
mgnify:CR=1 FL=1